MLPWEIRCGEVQPAISQQSEEVLSLGAVLHFSWKVSDVGDTFACHLPIFTGLAHREDGAGQHASRTRQAVGKLSYPTTDLRQGTYLSSAKGLKLGLKFLDVRVLHNTTRVYKLKILFFFVV